MKKPARFLSRAFVNNPGGFLLSHAVARAVPSAPRGLTSVFGMGTGVTLSTQPPENWFRSQISNLRSEIMKRTFSVAETRRSACEVNRTAEPTQSPRYGTCRNLKLQISKIE